MTASSVPDPRDHRELDLPAGAYEVAVAGWPRCDEQQLWDLADHWYAVAESADGAPGDAAERAHHAAARVVATLGGSGDAAAAFTQAWQAFSTSGDVPAATLREVADELGRLAEGYGRDVEAAKLEVWIELGRLAIQLWGDSVGAALTLGEAAPIAAGHLAANRVALQRVFRRLTAEVDPLAPAAVLRAAGRDATRHLSASLERRRRDEVARHFLHAAHRRDDLAVDAAEAAADARRGGPSALAEHLDLLSARAAAAQAELVQRARAVSDGDPVPATAPDHGGRPIGETRATSPGGLREQPPVPGTALERALSRDAAGRVTRHADPRVGGWFGLLNADGPGTDPGRANNDCDGVLALYETYLLGRPRVAAPRTFDGYAAGEPERPLGGETGGCARVEATTGGRFQGLCPGVGGLTPRDARQAVEHAFTNLHNHLANCGPGAFAFVAAQLEGGATHLWAAVNHDGTILHLDPQSRVLVEGHTPYPHAGRRDDGNVVLMDALVVDGRARYAPLPFHPLGPFGGSTARPVVPAADGPARVLLAEHVARLRHRVGPAVLAESTALANEIGALIGVAVPVTLRMRSAGALLDEAERSAADPADLVDAVSVRLVVPDTRTLAVALDRTLLRFPDRIRAVHDPRMPPDPGVHIVVSVRVDGLPYEFSLRLVAERAAGAADGPPAPTGTTARRATVATLRAATGVRCGGDSGGGVAVTGPAHLRYTHLFRYGEAYDDLHAAFVIDERGYDDPARARAEVHAAEAALRQTGVIYEIEVSAAGHARDIDAVPTWAEFRRRHFVDGVPLPVRPKPAERSVPPSWHAMSEEMDRASESLCDELLRSNRSAVPGADTGVLEHRGPVRHGSASVYLHEERFGFAVGVETELQDVPPDEALAAAGQVYEEAGWRLDTPVRDGTTVSRTGTRGLFRLRMAAEPGFLTVRTTSPLYRAPAAPNSIWLTEPRPDGEP